MRRSSLESLVQELKELRIRQGEIIAELEEHTRPSNEEPVNFRRGDRVYVINRVRKPASWNNNNVWREAEAKRGTVTYCERDRIYFTSDNGVRTWRLAHNLQRINETSEDE